MPARWLVVPSLAVALIVAAGQAGSQAAFGPVRSSPVLVWEWGAAKVVNAGQTNRVGVGDYFEGYEIVAEARAAGDDTPFERGLLKATLSAFRPDQDLPGQKAGLWHVRVKWTITDVAADPTVAAIRHNPHVLSGELSGTLKTDPASGRGPLALSGKAPRVFARNRWWASGQASFAGLETLEGTLTLSLR